MRFTHTHTHTHTPLVCNGCVVLVSFIACVKILLGSEYEISEKILHSKWERRIPFYTALPSYSLFNLQAQ